jgi:hypothetical protein
MHSPYSPSTEYDNMKLGKSLLCILCNSGDRRIIGYLQKLLYTVKTIRMSPTPTLNIYLFEGPIQESTSLFYIMLKRDSNITVVLLIN